MAASTAAIWAITDRTKTGLGLSALLAVAAPLGEAVIVALGLWHYERLQRLIHLDSQCRMSLLCIDLCVLCPSTLRRKLLTLR